MDKQVKCPIGGLYMECYDQCPHFGLHAPQPARATWGEGDLTCNQITHTCVRHKEPIKCGRVIDSSCADNFRVWRQLNE